MPIAIGIGGWPEPGGGTPPMWCIGIGGIGGGGMPCGGIGGGGMPRGGIIGIPCGIIGCVFCCEARAAIFAASIRIAIDAAIFGGGTDMGRLEFMSNYVELN